MSKIFADIYKDKLLKYPLTDFEYKHIDEVWDFLEIFTKQFVFISDYRKYVISAIRKKYTFEQFYFYESILNKMYWNLRWLLFPLWDQPDMDENEYAKFIKNNYGNTKKIPHSLQLCKYESYKDDRELDNKLKNNDVLNSTYYRSFINKLIIIDPTNKIILSKVLEGSSHIFSKNYFNLYTMTILFNPKKYNHFMKNPYLAKFEKVKLSEYYYQYDYAFPNINFCAYDFGTKEQKIDRIKKMFYANGPRKARYWFKLLKY